MLHFANSTHLMRKEGCRNAVQTQLYHTRAAPKVMPPVYLHGNYTRYKEHNNSLQALVHRWRKCIANVGDYVEK